MARRPTVLKPRSKTNKKYTVDRLTTVHGVSMTSRERPGAALTTVLCLSWQQQDCTVHGMKHVHVAFKPGFDIRGFNKVVASLTGISSFLIWQQAARRFR